MRTWKQALRAGLIAGVVGLLLAAAPAYADRIVVHDGQLIQRGINKADPGDVVFVRGGTYRESIKISKDDVDVRTRKAVLKQPSRHRESRCNSRNFVVGFCVVGKVDFQRQRVENPVVDANIRGFVVRGFSGDGIMGAGTRRLTLQRTKLVRNDGYGAFSLLSRRTAYHRNRAISNGETGLYVGDSPNARALVRRNKSLRNHGEGIFLRNASFGTVKENEVEGNCAGIVALADAPGPATNWKILRNDVNRNNQSCEGEGGGPPTSGIGIGIIGAADTVVRGNDAERNRPSGPSFASGGIVVSSGPGGTAPRNVSVVNSHAFHNSPDDLVWDGSGSVSFKGNHCQSSQPSGLCEAS